MTTKQTLLSLLGCLLLGVAIGRFTLPAKTETKTETKTNETDAKNTDTQDNSRVTVTKTVHPDGTATTVTVIDKNIDTKSQDKSSETVDNTKDKVVTYNTEKWSIMAVAAIQVLHGIPTTAYGGELQYRLLGPVKTGVLVLSSGTVGVSLGLEF